MSCRPAPLFVPLLLLLLLPLCANPLPATEPPPPPPALPSAANDERLWGPDSDRRALLRSIDESLRTLGTAAAARAYARQQAATGVTRDRVRRSLVRLRSLVRNCKSPEEMDAKLRREFVAYEPGGAVPVHFTGYFEPLYAASRVRTAAYRWPLYRPVSTGRPRAELEGRDGVPPPASPLRGRELIYLKDRTEAFLVQVQGSARLRLPDGRVVRVHNAGTNGQPYTSVGRQLVLDGKIAEDALTLPAVLEWLRAHPEDVSEYLSRNRRFVFFEIARDAGSPPTGSTGARLTAERSIATDKRLLPPGAPALIRFDLVNPEAAAAWGRPAVTRLVLDQDAGSAIRGPARVDLFVGSGPAAGLRAGVVNSTGRLCYLLLRE
jgi:membrane-bound lytic murein transglycosylase A